MTIRRECSKCNGTGRNKRLWPRESVNCGVCGGTGYIEIENVLPFVGITRIDGEADNVLRHALGELDNVVIVGYDKDGNEFYASNIADGANALWHLQRGIHNLMTIIDKESEE